MTLDDGTNCRMPSPVPNATCSPSANSLEDFLRRVGNVKSSSQGAAAGMEPLVDRNFILYEVVESVKTWK